MNSDILDRWNINVNRGLRGALKEAKSGNVRRNQVRNAQETTAHDNNDTNDKPESFKYNTSTEDTTNTSKPENTPMIPNVLTTPTNLDSNDS